ncbi:hypothetical protein GOV14_01825 [Candidatus Pacearchaeota archaeon]|nr:hypothetical protein [Candidatus Pacearchaeota archaeon]
MVKNFIYVCLKSILLVSALFLLSFTFGIFIVEAAIPYGASNVSQFNTSTAVADAPVSHNAQAGNVTELNIFGYSTTQSWQGYFGNVSGTVQLGDSSDNIFYNWSVVSPLGEVYASTNDSIDWINLQCFNFTASGSYADDSANRGSTSQYGMNLTQLESLYNIDVGDVDGVNETFALNTTSEAHDSFYTNSLEFATGECASTFVYDDTGGGIDNKFEEVLLYDPDTVSVIFASLLEQDAAGFDGRAHDFEMLVLEDGHDTDTSTTPYYFYVELQ